MGADTLADPSARMPYVDGESIDVRLRRSRTLGVRETLGIVKDAARGAADGT